MLHGSHHLRITTMILTCASTVITALLVLARVLGIITWDWRWIMAPAAIVLVSWVLLVLIVLATLWIMVRIGKDIP